jgi:hypothetical protein
VGKYNDDSNTRQSAMLYAQQSWRPSTFVHVFTLHTYTFMPAENLHGILYIRLLDGHAVTSKHDVICNRMPIYICISVYIDT